MSTRFEKQIIMPAGTMGRTTLMDLPDEDIKSVERWHLKEWNEFCDEIIAYKTKTLEVARSAYRWNRDKCIACSKMRDIKSKYYQRGSIMVGAAGVASSAHILFGGDCSYTQTTTPTVNDFGIEPGDVWAMARLHSDGDWYWVEGSSGWGAADGTWQGNCAVADYDTRWNTVSGDAPNYLVSGTTGVWSAATTSKALGYNHSGFADLSSGSFSLECRDGTSLTLLFTDSFLMSAELDPGC